MLRALSIPIAMFFVSLTMVPGPAGAQPAHPLLGEVETLRAPMDAEDPLSHHLTFRERNNMARRLHEAAAHERDPHTRALMREAAVHLYTDFGGLAPQEIAEAFLADAQAAGDYAQEVAAMEEIVRITRNNFHMGEDEVWVSENAVPVYDELEALLRQAPPELAPQYEERLNALLAETAEYMLRYRHHFGEETMLEEAIRRYEAYFEQTAVTDHDALDHLGNLAEAYQYEGRLEEAADTYWSVYEHAVALGPSGDPRRMHRQAPSSAFRGYLWNAFGEDSAEYREEFRNFLLEHPPDRTTTAHIKRLVGLYMERGEHAEAISLLERWVELDGENLLPHFRLGTALMLAGRTDEAEAVFERIRTMAGRENTFVLMAENELHAIRGGRRSGESWWLSALDRVVDFSAAAEPGQATARSSVDSPPRAAISEPQQSPSADAPSLVGPIAVGTIAVLVLLLFLAARRV